MLYRKLSLLLALSWMALLFYMSHQPSIDAPALFPHQDKAFHALFYGVLGVFLLAALPLKNGGYSPKQVRTSVLIASLYGMSDEFHQYFIPGRSSDPADWLADTVGALLAVLLLAWLSRKWKPALEVARS